MRLNYNDILLLAIWEYNRRQDEDLTLELFQETFGQVPGAHFHDKWVHYYNKNLLMMAAYFRGEWKSHATLTLLAKQDLPTFGYNMIDPLKSWCWGSILFYPFKISRFS